MKRKVVGVEIEGDSLKIAYLTLSRHGFTVVSLIDKEIESGDVSDFIKTSLITNFKIKKPEVMIIIPSSLVTTKNIEIPSIDPEEIESVVALQVGRYTPYSREEVITGYTAITTYQAKYTRILLAIVHKNAIKQRIDILNKANIKETKIVFAAEAIAYWYYSSLKVKDRDCFAVLHINSKFSDFIVAKGKKLVFIRTFPLLDLEHSYDKLEEEVKNSLESYEKEGITESPKKLVVSGALKDIEKLKFSLGIPVEAISYFKGLNMQGSLKETASSTSFLPAIASLAQGDKLKIDFLPVELKMQRRLEAKGREVIKTGILIVTAFIFIWGIFLTKVYTKSAYLKKLTLDYEDLNNKAMVWEEAMSKLKVIKKYLARQNKSLDILSALSQAVPKTIYLTDLAFEGKESVNIKGTADFIAEVFSFVSNLEASRCFKNVKIKYTTKRKERDKESAVFEITGNLE